MQDIIYKRIIFLTRKMIQYFNEITVLKFEKKIQIILIFLMILTKISPT